MLNVNKNIVLVIEVYIMILLVEFFHFGSDLNIIIMLESLICFSLLLYLLSFVLQNIIIKYNHMYVYLKVFIIKLIFNIGTIGHVDHGKTTLTAAITYALHLKGYKATLNRKFKNKFYLKKLEKKVSKRYYCISKINYGGVFKTGLNTSRSLNSSSGSGGDIPNNQNNSKKESTHSIDSYKKNETTGLISVKKKLTIFWDYLNNNYENLFVFDFNKVFSKKVLFSETKKTVDSSEKKIESEIIYENYLNNKFSNYKSNGEFFFIKNGFFKDRDSQRSIIASNKLVDLLNQQGDTFINFTPEELSLFASSFVNLFSHSLFILPLKHEVDNSEIFIIISLTSDKKGISLIQDTIYNLGDLDSNNIKSLKELFNELNLDYSGKLTEIEELICFNKVINLSNNSNISISGIKNYTPLNEIIFNGNKHYALSQLSIKTTEPVIIDGNFLPLRGIINLFTHDLDIYNSLKFKSNVNGFSIKYSEVINTKYGFTIQKNLKDIYTDCNSYEEILTKIYCKVCKGKSVHLTTIDQLVISLTYKNFFFFKDLSGKYFFEILDMLEKTNDLITPSGVISKEYFEIFINYYLDNKFLLLLNDSYLKRHVITYRNYKGDKDPHNIKYYQKILKDNNNLNNTIDDDEIKFPKNLD